MKCPDGWRGEKITLSENQSLEKILSLGKKINYELPKNGNEKLNSICYIELNI